MSSTYFNHMCLTRNGILPKRNVKRLSFTFFPVFQQFARSSNCRKTIRPNQAFSEADTVSWQTWLDRWNITMFGAFRLDKTLDQQVLFIYRIVSHPIFKVRKDLTHLQLTKGTFNVRFCWSPPPQCELLFLKTKLCVAQEHQAHNFQMP